MGRVEILLYKNQHQQEILKGEIDKLKPDAEAGNRDAGEKITRLESQLNELEKEKTVILAYNKKISDGLPQHERYPDRGNARQIDIRRNGYDR